jgi:hypothetical protein
MAILRLISTHADLGFTTLTVDLQPSLIKSALNQFISLRVDFHDGITLERQSWVTYLTIIVIIHRRIMRNPKGKDWVALNILARKWRKGVGIIV